jgi:hypothetical protein
LQDDYETVAFVGLNREPGANASKVTFFHRSHHTILLDNERADDNYTDIVGAGRAVSKTTHYEKSSGKIRTHQREAENERP